VFDVHLSRSPWTVATSQKLSLASKISVLARRTCQATISQGNMFGDPIRYNFQTPQLTYTPRNCTRPHLLLEDATSKLITAVTSPTQDGDAPH
jgi:hypothetical protein